MLEACLINLVDSLVGLSLEVLKVMPGSTIFIFILTLAINLLTSWVSRSRMDLEKMKEITIKATHVRREMMKAVRSGNKRLLAKLQKEQQEINKDQMAMSAQRMKFQLFFFIPFFMLFSILRTFFANTGPVALVPFNAPFLGTELTWFWWYFFCSIGSNVLIQRLLGLTFEVP